MKRGYIKERKKGTFLITVELPKENDGKYRNRKNFTVKGTRKDAEKFLTEKLSEIDRGLLVYNRKMKYKDYLDLWKEKTFVNLEITTIDGYVQKIEKHIKPYLGNIYIEDMKPLHLQNLYDKLLSEGNINNNKGLSERTVLAIHRIIHSSLKQAVRWQLIVRNIADCVEPPRAKKYKASFLSDEETRILLKKSEGTEIYIPIAIAIYTGARRGEILGLKWENINLDKGYIKIINNLCSTSKGIITKTPKTQDSIRNIAISDTLINILKQHKIEQLKNKMLLGGEYIDNNFVCSYYNGKPFNPKRFSTKFHELLKKNNLPIIRFHDLRHSHASLLVKLGVQPKEISARLGHSNIGITMDLYSHLYEDVDKDVADKFEKLISS